MGNCFGGSFYYAQGKAIPMDLFMKIIPYILNIVSSGILAFAVWLVNKIRKDRQTECNSQKAVSEGIEAMLRDRIIQKGEYHIGYGWCSPENKTVVEKMYKPYAALGGNDVATKVYEHVMALPEVPQKKEEEK